MQSLIALGFIGGHQWQVFDQFLKKKSIIETEYLCHAECKPLLYDRICDYEIFCRTHLLEVCVCVHLKIISSWLSRNVKTQSSFLPANSPKPACDLLVWWVLVCTESSQHRELTWQHPPPHSAMHNTTHFTSFLSSNMSLCKTHTVCTYICMSKPALLSSLLWSDSTGGTAVLDLPLPLPLRLSVPSWRSAAPVLQPRWGERDKRRRFERVFLKGWAPSRRWSMSSVAARGRETARHRGLFIFTVCMKRWRQSQVWYLWAQIG